MNKTIAFYEGLIADDDKDLQRYYKAYAPYMDKERWIVLKDIVESKRISQEMIEEELEINGYRGGCE